MTQEDKLGNLVRRTFNTDAGQDLLEELKATYVGNNFNENPYVTARNCGKSDLIMFIQSILDEK